MNTEARLKLELSKAQVEIQRLRERLSLTPPTVHKDFSLVSRVLNGQVRNQPSHGRNFSPISKDQRGLDVGGRRTVFK
jgi:hypothetical protein